jgi:hypothetical protein
MRGRPAGEIKDSREVFCIDQGSFEAEIVLVVVC